MKSAWMGIDPGAEGAIGVITDTGQVYLINIPILEIENPTTKQLKRCVDIQMLKTFLEPWREHVEMCAIESVHAFPKQGTASMFSFGRNFGTLECALAFMGIPTTYVLPTTWKKVVIQDMGRDKDASILRFQQLFPHAYHLLTEVNKKLREGRAEAGLIAAWVKNHFRVTGEELFPAKPKVKSDRLSRGDIVRAQKAKVFTDMFYEDGEVPVIDSVLDNLHLLGGSP